MKLDVIEGITLRRMGKGLLPTRIVRHGKKPTVQQRTEDNAHYRTVMPRTLEALTRKGLITYDSIHAVYRLTLLGQSEAEK